VLRRQSSDAPESLLKPTRRSDEEQKLFLCTAKYLPASQLSIFPFVPVRPPFEIDNARFCFFGMFDWLGV
jgi:hypothetical protein